MPLTNVTVRFLEMTSPAQLRPRRTTMEGVTIARVKVPMPELNRFFYAAVGGEYSWIDRRDWSGERWREYVQRPELETCVLTVEGIPAGYFELERASGGQVEIRIFGLFGPFIGKGLGAHMLTAAVEAAWAGGAARVIVDTCSLDHPNAFEHYLARGFTEYRTDVVRKDVPERVTA